jgi:hypothetical protein
MVVGISCLSIIRHILSPTHISTHISIPCNRNEDAHFCHIFEDWAFRERLQVLILYRFSANIAGF